MYLVAIAWFHVVPMMALAEAVAPQGSVIGAFFTLLPYGALPLSIVLHIMATPGRRRALRAAAAAARSKAPDGGGHAAGDPVAAEGKEG